MFFKQFNAFGIIVKNVAIQLMQLQCFKTVINKACQCHRGKSFSSVFFICNEYSQTCSFMKGIKIKNIYCTYCLLVRQYDQS